MTKIISTVVFVSILYQGIHLLNFYSKDKIYVIKDVVSILYQGIHLLNEKHIYKNAD